jgi:hypothetical protein
MHVSAIAQTMVSTNLKLTALQVSILKKGLPKVH